MPSKCHVLSLICRAPPSLALLAPPCGSQGPPPFAPCPTAPDPPNRPESLGVQFRKSIPTIRTSLSQRGANGGNTFLPNYGEDLAQVAD